MHVLHEQPRGPGSVPVQLPGRVHGHEGASRHAVHGTPAGLDEPLDADLVHERLRVHRLQRREPARRAVSEHVQRHVSGIGLRSFSSVAGASALHVLLDLHGECMRGLAVLLHSHQHQLHGNGLERQLRDGSGLLFAAVLRRLRRLRRLRARHQRDRYQADQRVQHLRHHGLQRGSLLLQFFLGQHLCRRGQPLVHDDELRRRQPVYRRFRQLHRGLRPHRRRKRHLLQRRQRLHDR